MSKKIISLFLVIVMLMGLAVPAMAAEPDHDISTGALAITANGNYTVTGSTTANNISVAENVTATITLKDASIQLSGGSISGGDSSNMDSAGTAAIAIAQGANVTLILEGSNSLKSGAGRAAIEVMGNKQHVDGASAERTPATLTIKGSGSLTATGGSAAAGIGGSFCMNAGIINIEGGTINAIVGGDGYAGAGIGGCHAGDRVNKAYGSFSEINISGGVINADGKVLGAGIGAGAHGNCDGAVINITGGVITAQGGTYRQDPGDGIGLAHGGSSKTPPQVNISGNAVVNASSINTKNSSQGAGKTAITGGVLSFDKGSTYNVYGDTTIGADLSVNNLTFGDSGYTLTVPTNVTLTITGSAIGTGTIKLEGGMLEGEDKLAETITLDKGPYKMVLKVSNNAPVYGDTITLTATAKTREDAIYSVAPGVAVFTVGGEAIGEVSFTDGVAVMEYTVAVPAGNQLIKASATFEGITYANGVAVTVAKAEQNITLPAPTAAENGVTFNLITLNPVEAHPEGKGDVEYAYVQKPAEGEPAEPTNWQTAVEFTDLMPDTTYAFYVRHAGNDYYEPTAKSAGTEITTTALSPLPTPVMPEKGHEVSYNKIILAAPEVNASAVTQYSISKDGGVTWEDWKDSNEFNDIEGSTEYKFKARYIVKKYDHSSEDSNVITLTTPETPMVTVSLRIIGANNPEVKPDFTADPPSYGDAVYQNWFKTKEYTVPVTMTGRDVLELGLADAGLNYDMSSNNIYKLVVEAPQIHGGHTLGYGTISSNRSSWYITWQRNGEYTEYRGNYKTLPELQDGDAIILHYVFDYRRETESGANATNPDLIRNYLKIADSDPADLAAAQNVIDLIEAIGNVTKDSGPAITAARQAYDALNDVAKEAVPADVLAVLVEAERVFDENSNYEGEKINLAAPSIDAVEAGLYSAVLTVTGNNDEYADDVTVLYSVSADGVNWGAWMEGTTVNKLLPAKTYYVRVKAASIDNWAKYNDSDASEAVELTTAGGDAEVTQVTTKEELATALTNAKTDGTLTVVDITADIIINDLPGEFYNATLPEGANVLLTSSNDSKFWFNEPGGGSFIAISAGSTITIRGLEMGAAAGSSALMPTNEAQKPLRISGEGGVINLDNVKMYSEHGSGMIAITEKAGTLNIYSGSLSGILDSKVMNVSKATINLIPTGNIMIEGIVNGASSFNVVNMFGAELTAVSTADRKIYSAVEYIGETIGYGMGLRLYTDGTVTLPTAVTAPVVAAAGSDEAATADVTYVIEDNKITFTVKNKSAKEGTSVFQMGRSDYGYIWLRTTDGEGAGATYEYAGLKKDTEYSFTLRYRSLHAKYTDAETQISLTTTFTPVALTAPTLVDDAVKSHDTITLTAPAASAEDTTATLEYRISEDGENWGEWQASAVFENLQPGTTYYFQARYKAVHKYWLDSAESNTVEIKTSAATLAAPVLSAEAAVITANTIEIAAPAASEQDPAAIVMYYMSADGQTWGDGQQSRTFIGLEGNTKYYFAAQYISTNNNKYLDSAMSEAIEISTTFDENAPIFVVGDVTGRAGGTVDVTVDMKNNPGIVNVKLNVSYDQDKLELVGVKDAELLPNFTKSQNYTVYPYVVYWEDSTSESNITASGILVTLTFKIKETCPEGSNAEVSVSYDANDVYDVNLDNVEFAIANGGVTVEDHNWSAVTYTWSADYLTCTAERECTDEGCDVDKETETVNAIVDETPASCAAPGEIVYTAVFTNTAFQMQTHTKILEQDEHIWAEVSGGDNAALVKTCTLGHTDEVDVSESTPVITVADVLSNNKNEIKVAVSVKNNPGFKAMSFTLKYDGSKLQLLGAENKTTLTAFEHSGNVITIGGAGENAEYTANGDIVILTFKALADCEDASVALTYKIADVYNAEAEEVLFAIDNGKVSAADFIAGDVNGDSKVDLKDVTYLRRHLANWDGYKSIVKFAADVDGDGFVEQKDVAYLLRHVAEYEGYEKLGR